MLRITTTRTGALRFDVRVQPRASRTGISGVHDSALRVRLQVPPVDGAANTALVALIAESLGVPRRDVRIVAGAASRTKVLEVVGVERGAVERLAGGGRAGT